MAKGKHVNIPLSGKGKGLHSVVVVLQVEIVFKYERWTCTHYVLFLAQIT